MSDPHGPRQDKYHAKRLENRMSRCKHFTGIQHDTCQAGVRYDDVKNTAVRPYGFPCLLNDSADATCDKRELPTQEEAEEEIRQSNAAIERVNLCRVAIVAKHGKQRGLADQMACPTGCGGTLQYSIAGYNGHIHGRCSTKGCAAWME